MTEDRRQKNRKRALEWYHNNTERAKARCVANRRATNDRLRLENPRLLILRRVQNSASGRGLEFTISVDDIEIPETCPILGIRLEINQGTSKGNSPSVDRIDNTKGYIPGNVAVISQRANRLKSNMDFKTIRALYNYVSRLEKTA